MGGSQDLWLNVANAGLGIFVVALLLGTLLACVVEVVSGFNRRFELRAELERDLRKPGASYLDVPPARHG